MYIEVASAGLSLSLQEALNRLRPTILERVLVPHLHVPAHFRSDEFYVLPAVTCDDGTHEPFVAVCLSGVSLNADRAPNLVVTRTALIEIYASVIRGDMGATDPVVRLNVIIELDMPLHGSPLIEGPAQVVGCAGD